VIAVNRRDPAGLSAIAVMPKDTEVRHPVALQREKRTQGGSGATKEGSGGESSIEPGESESTSTSTPMSNSSAEQSNTSNKRWHRPKTVREFAAQANSIATMILNGEIDMEVAKGYASLARVVAQSASIEVTRARFLKQEPDLSLEAGDDTND
jgi:hypothetical protein